LDSKSTLYLFYLTTSNSFRIEAEGKMSGSAGQQRVPSSFFQDYKIALPSIDEQFEIGLRLDKINQKLQTEQAYLQKLYRLKACFMGDLLSGKVTVKNDKPL
jgi:type I restriction enzyme S subunit